MHVNRFALNLLFSGTLLLSNSASAQLSKWILRAGSGEVRTLDFNGGGLQLGNVIGGFGNGGSEDVNLMTDGSGQALFYAAVGSNNHIQVRNAALAVMPNGQGLLGHSSSHSSAIAPRPCHPGQYYMIHLNTTDHELRYSIIDMDLHGGMGDVTLKNKLIGGGIGEGLAVSRQLPGGCRWLFTYGIAGSIITLKRSLISDQGISTPEDIGSVDAPNGTAWYSVLKLSPANDRIAISLPNAIDPGAADIVVWPLDAVTGSIGGAHFLPISNDPIVGIEFSPGGQYLYYAGNGASADMEFGRVHLATSEAQVIDPAIGPWVASIECASNGRVYIGTAGYPRTLAEVRFPDASTLPGIAYDRNALVFLSLGFLPTLPNSIEGEPPGAAPAPAYVDFDVQELPQCSGHRFVPKACLASSYQWDFGDGWTDAREQPTHRYGVGTFDVSLTVHACGQDRTLMRADLITVEGIQPHASFNALDSVCQHQSTEFINSSELASEYHWWFGDGAQSTQEEPMHAFNQHGQMSVTLVAAEGCILDTARQAIRVMPAAIASFHTGSDPCDERTYLVNTSVGGVDWRWDFGDGDTVRFWRDPNHIYRSMGEFNVELVSDPYTMCADTARATLQAGYGLIPVAWFVPNAFTPNNDGTNDVLKIVGPEQCQSPIMSLHNKWGQLIWEGDARVGWDGTVHGMPAPEGVYGYALRGRNDDLRFGWFVLAR